MPFFFCVIIIMTKKQAYCCLNCAADLPPCSPSLSPCSVAAGDCVECCEDCKNTSECSSSAYFYDGNFYKHFKFEAQQYDDTLFNYDDQNFLHYFSNNGYYTSKYDTRVCPPCCLIGRRRTYDDTTYWSKEDVRYNCEETTTISDSEACRDAATEIDECPTTTTVPSQCYLGAALYSSDDPTPATECFPQFPDFLDKAGTVACRSTDDCYNQICVIDYPGACDDNPACIPFAAFNVPCSSTQKKAYTEFYSKIEFFSPLNLYNSDGQVVGNTISATYNPCTPTSSWSAPACHFFHP
jgi:hypothetical protein